MGSNRDAASRREETVIRALHVADLHATDPPEEDQDRLAESAIEGAAALLEGRPVHLLVFSGDLTKAGQGAECRLGASILLEKAMARFNLGPGQVILVPGNHDVDLGQIERDEEPGLRDSLTSQADVDVILGDAEKLALATVPLTQWTRFYRDFYADHPPHRPGPLAAVHRYRFRGTSVGVAALNSAWLSEGRGDKGRLVVGRSQLRPALDAIEDAEIRLVVVHHPLDWLADFDARELRAEFFARGVTVLSGHLHSPEAVAHESSDGELLGLQAGCLYVHPEYPNSYSLVEIDSEVRIASVHFRRWYSRRKTFDADLDIAPNGQDEFDLPRSRKARERKHPRFADVVGSLAEAASRLRIDS